MHTLKAYSTKAALLFALAWPFCPQTVAAEDEIPDLSGNYNVATLTPLQRPEIFGDNLYMKKWVADLLAFAAEFILKFTAQDSDPDREAPPVGGDGSAGAAGNVGGYNTFWIDPGDAGFQLDGRFRTSIIYTPTNGRQPELTEFGLKKRTARFTEFFKPNEGRAWWLDSDETGPYDDPELRPLGERCLLGFGSTSGPPMLPVLYNNLKRIVQTPQYIMILNEMVHDTRIIRLDDEHLPPAIKKWMGDSIGHWDGDTLVVDTTNFTSRPALGLASEHLHVIERFRRKDENTLHYSFTVDDPTIWKEPWSGEYPWPATDNSVFEYACHEGNYALGNILRGARLLEREASGGED